MQGTAKATESPNILSCKHKQLIMMVLQKRFTAVAFPAWKISGGLVFCLSWVYCRSETNKAHYSDKTFQRSDSRSGMECVFLLFVRNVSPQKHFLFSTKEERKRVVHTFANVILFWCYTSIVTQAKLRLGYGNLIFMLAWHTCQINLNVLISHQIPLFLAFSFSAFIFSP